MRSMLLAVAVALVVAVTCAPRTPSRRFHTGRGGPEYRAGPGEVPSDLSGDDNEWKYAATPEANSPYTANARELFGVRGARVVDRSAAAETAWQTTTGRADVKIAVLDSGIKWNDAGAMLDLRRKTALNRGELPHPERGASLHHPGCTEYDCNGDGVFNVDDYSSDSRVSLSELRRVGPAGVLTPQDLLIAFSNGNDGDSNGFVDDIAGWDFLDNDNDAYDDVQYGHGTGEAQGSSAEADNGNNAGSCPNCIFMPLRVGDSFVADTNAFGQAVIYAVDSGALVVQEALGTIDQTAARPPGGRGLLPSRRRRDRLGRGRGRTASQLAVELLAHDRGQLGHAVGLVHTDAVLRPVQRLHELLDARHGRHTQHQLLFRCHGSRIWARGPDLQRGSQRDSAR